MDHVLQNIIYIYIYVCVCVGVRKGGFEGNKLETTSRIRRKGQKCFVKTGNIQRTKMIHRVQHLRTVRAWFLVLIMF